MSNAQADPTMPTSVDVDGNPVDLNTTAGKLADLKRRVAHAG